MDTGKSGGQTSSLDSLRTVEFRQTLRGYHIDDVDEYLERVAVDAEALQEQMRQAGDRLKQAAERIAQLEAMLQEAQQAQPAAGPAVADDTLQRTLVLAQKFIDQTQAEAETQARVVVAEAENRARVLIGEAEKRAKSVTEDTERNLREEVGRLESLRTQLAGEVETVARHLDNERDRLRGALNEMLAWVEEHVQPAATLLAQRASQRPPPRIGESPVTAAPVAAETDETGDGGAAMAIEGGAGRPAVPVQGNAATGGARPPQMTASPSDNLASPSEVGERPGVMPVDSSSPSILPR
jgi:DivIVA domain-containing protein